MRMMNFCKLLFAVLLFFRHFWAVFQTLLLPLFSLHKNKIKNGIHAHLSDSKAEMKVWYPWFVIRYFFGPWTVPEEPTPSTCGILCVLIGYPSGHWGPTCLLRISRVCPARKTSLCDHIINPLLIKFVRPRWLGIALVLFCVLTSEICAILDRCTFCRSTKRSMKKVLSQRFLLSSFKTLYNAKYLQNAGKLETWELENNVGTTHFSFVQTNLVPRVEEDPGNEVVFTRTNFPPAEKVTGYSVYTGPFNISTL